MRGSVSIGGEDHRPFLALSSSPLAADPSPFPLVSHQLEAVSGHLEPLAAQVLGELRVELGDEVGVEVSGQVVDRARCAGIGSDNGGRDGRRSGAGLAGIGRELGRHTGLDQGLEGLVDGGQADPGIAARTA